MTHDHEHHEAGGERAGLPPELRAVDQRLGALAELERASSPAGLEERLLARTRALLVSGRPDHSGGTPAPAPLAFPRRAIWVRYSVAAAVALAAVGVVGALCLLPRATPSQPEGTPIVKASDDLESLKSEIDAFLALATPHDADTEATLTSIGDELSRVESGADGFWGSDSDSASSAEDSLL